MTEVCISGCDEACYTHSPRMGSKRRDLGLGGQVKSRKRTRTELSPEGRTGLALGSAGWGKQNLREKYTSNSLRPVSPKYVGACGHRCKKTPGHLTKTWSAL